MSASGVGFNACRAGIAAGTALLGLLSCIAVAPTACSSSHPDAMQGNSTADAADLDSATMPPPADGASGSLGVTCGATRCSRDQVCCVTAGPDLTITGPCTAPTDCAGTGLNCNGPQDCAGGETCCGQISIAGGASATCQAVCAGLTLCQVLSDCPTGTHCLRVNGGGGVRVCGNLPEAGSAGADGEAETMATDDGGADATLGGDAEPDVAASTDGGNDVTANSDGAADATAIGDAISEEPAADIESGNPE